MKKPTLADIPTVPVKATPSELQALLRELPKFPLEPQPDKKSMLQALKKSSTFADLLKHLYPTQASEFFAAGALAKRHAEPKKYTVGTSATDLDDDLPGEGHVGIVGDLEVKGGLDIGAVLVVTGDLTVQGVLEDCGPESRVVVHGSLHCKHLFSSGWILVGGDVRVDGLIYGFYNDDALEVLGDIEAGIILSHDHSIDAMRKMHVKHAPKKRGVWGKQPIFDVYSNEDHIEEVKKLLGAKILDEDNQLDTDVARRVKL